MANIFGWVLIGVLAMLMLLETVRFQRARGDAEALPYPRNRLVRRIALGCMLAGVLLIVIFWPPASIGLRTHLLLLGGIGILLIIAAVLWLKDLHETSRAAVEFAQREHARETGAPEA